MDMKEDLLAARFVLNMKRIAGLTKLVLPGWRPPAPTEVAIETEDVRADLFRAIVVLLHATFEDVLRTGARQRLGDAAPEVLKNIPLVGTNMIGRAEKFHLGSLAAHREKTVDHLIRESVDDYLTRKSFGSCAAVEEILCQMALDTKPFKSLYPYLDSMMKRRHRIVHEADLSSPQDTSSPPWTFVDHFELCFWNLAVLAFHAQLRVSLDPKDELQRWFYERRTKAIELLMQSPKEIAVMRDQYADGKSMIAGFQKRVEDVMQQVAAQLRPPSPEELLTLAERITANKPK